MKQEVDVKKTIEEANQTNFITCTELAKEKIVVYVTEKAVMLRDNVLMENSVLIPFDEFIKHRDEIIEKRMTNDGKDLNSSRSAETMADEMPAAQS